VNTKPELNFGRLTIESALTGILAGLLTSKAGMDNQSSVIAGLAAAGILGGARASTPPAKKSSTKKDPNNK
jgi:hypothetical protein